MKSTNWGVLFVALLLVSGCNKKAADNKPIQGAIPVTVVQSTARPMELIEESVGTLESLTDPTISAEVPGKVVQIRAVAGSAIREGETLAVLDSRDVDLARSAAQAEVQRVGILINNQTKNLERLQQLRQKNFISQSALDDAIAQTSALRNQVRAAQAQLALAERNVSKAQIVSPVNGRVEKQIAVRGQYVKVGDPLFQLVTLGSLRARLPFPEKFSAQLERGMTVRLSSPADDQVISGKISEIRPMAESNSRAFDVFVSLNNPGNWKPGASVLGKVVLGEHPNAVVVPESSVVMRPAGKVLYVVSGGKAEQRQVQTGIEQDGVIEVTRGLQPGEAVVVDGAGFLTDQVQVAIKSPMPLASSAVSATH